MAMTSGERGMERDRRIAGKPRPRIWRWLTTPVSHGAERADGEKSGHRRRSPHAAEPRAVRQKPAVAALADESDLGVKACGASP
jgi:hypothetical protein